MRTPHGEALQVVETVKRAGRIYEDSRNHVWYVPTAHPIFSAVAMVAGAVSRQIASGLLDTGIDGSRRFAQVSLYGEALLAERRDSPEIADVDRWLADLLPEEEELASER